jgi:hypothetical protein
VRLLPSRVGGVPDGRERLGGACIVHGVADPTPVLA